MLLLPRLDGRNRWLAMSAALAVAMASCLVAAPLATGVPAHDATANTKSTVAADPPALAPEPSWAPLVDQLYESILHRPADAAGRSYWGNLMDSTTTAASGPTAAASTISFGLAHSSEAKGSQVVAAYQDLLGRTPDAGGLAFWSGFLGSAHTLEQMWVGIAGSAEFAHHAGNPAAMVDALYETILGRPADTGGKAYWSSYLTRTDPMSVAVILVLSSEYAHRTVISAYEQALYRTPDAGGLAYWSNLVASGSTGAISLLATLAGTSESVNYGCDPTAGAACLLPFPNDLYTRTDGATATGRRVNMKPVWTPANTQGTHIDTQQINRSDGFSPGAPAIVQVPGLDLGQTANVPTVDEPSRSLAPNSPVTVFDAATGDQQPVWAELDQFPASHANPMLFIRPATNYVDGHTYVVVLRNLKNASGASIAANPVFQAYLDGHDLPGVAGFEAHKAATTQMLNELDGWGVSRNGMYLAWQFTVASTANLTGRLIHIRNDAFQRMGGANGLTNDAVPSFAVTSDTAPPQSGGGALPGIARVVNGTFAVPSYLTGDGSTGTVFNTGSDGLPQYSGNSYTAQFRCIIPNQALTTPGIPSVYGVGLFGSVGQVQSDTQAAMATRFGRVYCATPEIGMADEDEVPAVNILQDFSKFPTLVDRLQQGVLNELFLARLLNSPGGFNTDPAFQNADQQGVIEPHEVTYDGNSQGGILGGVLTAVSTDLTRAVLGTTGTDYATLMERSTDFTTFFAVMNGSYPERTSQIIAVDLIQMQWDRAEPNGYADHIVDNLLPDTPAHKVLMLLAYGDHQVTNWAGDTEARTIARNGGMKAECPKVEPDRIVGEWPLWNVPCITSYPFDGSAVVYNDTGSNPPPLANVPPPEPPNGGVENHDPHNDPQGTPAIQDQKNAFLRTGGAVTDTCNGACKFPPPS